MSSTRDLVLFFLATTAKKQEEADVFSSTVFPYLTYAQLSWRLPNVPQSTLRGAVATLQRESLISTVQRGGGTHMRLTSVGREAVLAQFPRSVFLKKKWDERWRVLIFRGVREFGHDYLDKEKKTILSQEYRALRGTLSTWGFMSLTRGVYATPFPIDDRMISTLAKAKKLKLLIGLETRRFLFGDEKEFVRQSWNMDFLSKQYAKLRTRAVSLLHGVERQNELNDSIKHQFSLLSTHIYQMVKSDPGLPAQLLPDDFQAEKCWSTYIALSASLATREEK